MESKQEKKKARKLYEKPRLRTIELAADEVLATGCKTIDGTMNVGQPFCGLGVGCAVEGS